jgi:hypothetical protein
VSKISKNNGYSDACLEKKKEKEEMNKIAHVFLAKLFPNSKKESGMFSRSKVELG